MVAGERFYRDLLRFSGRRRRGSYFDLTLILLFQGILVAIIAATLAPIGLLLLWVWIGPAAIAYNIAGAQRCRDIGWTGWAVLLNYVPIVGFAIYLVLLFYPGMRGPNRYGPDPLAAMATNSPSAA